MIGKKSIVTDSNKFNENQAALDRVAGTHSRSRRHISSANADELIGTLSDAHENRRARQVLEWEKARRGRLMDL